MLKRKLSGLCKFSISSLMALSLLIAPQAIADDTKNKKEWKISAYMDGDSEIDQACFWNVNDMEKIGSNEQVDILVQLDRSENQIGYNYNSNDHKLPDSKAKRYHIKKDENMEKINSPKLGGFEKEINMGNLKEFEDFVKWTKQTDSEKQIFVIKGHGFGIMQPLERILDEKDGPDYANDTLPVYTIEKVFDKNLEKKLDMLIFDSCAMATIETAYQLRKHAKVMIASEAIMFYSAIYNPVSEKWEVLTPGIEYEKVLNYLTKNPQADTKTLAKAITSSFHEKFRDDRLLWDNISIVDIVQDQEATLSATNLENLETFVDKFEKFSKTLINRLEDDKTREATVKALYETTREVQKYMPPDFDGLFTYVDLFDFLKKLDQKVKDEELNNSIKTLKKSDIILGSVYNNPEFKDSNGLTILFLEDLDQRLEKEKETASKIKDYYNGSDFAKKTGWGRVMDLYQGYYPQFYNW